MNRKSVTAYLGRTRDGDRVYAELSITREDKPATTVEHATVNETVRLSASGFTIPKGRRLADSVGQVLDVLNGGLVKDRSAWSASDVRSLRTLWRRWHLNDMRAGCAHQEPVYAPDQFGRSVPSLDLTPACPVSGYRYGHAWLYEEPPADVVAEWERLMSLPTGNVPTEY